MSSHPSSRNRHRRVKLRNHYAKIREDVQLHGIIETTPEGAVRRERVEAEPPPLASLPGLVMDAVRNDWDTPPAERVKAVDDLLKILHDESLDPGRRIQAFNALRHADRDVWERLNPELAGKVKGGGVQITNQQQVVTGDMMIKALQDLEKFRGQPIMSEAMLQIEQDASAVLPEEIA